MTVCSLFLGRMVSGAGNDLADTLFVFAGILPWTLFARAVSSASQSLVGSQNLITKFKFPKSIIPMGAIAAGVIDFGMLLLLTLFCGVLPGWVHFLAPLLVLVLIVTALGVGTLLSAWTIAYRDFRPVVPFLEQLWRFAAGAMICRWKPESVRTGWRYCR